MKKYEIRKGVTAKDVRDSGLKIPSEIPDGDALIAAINYGEGMMEMSFYSAARVLVSASPDWTIDGAYPKNRYVLTKCPAE